MQTDFDNNKKNVHCHVMDMFRQDWPTHHMKSQMIRFLIARENQQSQLDQPTSKARMMMGETRKIIILVSATDSKQNSSYKTSMLASAC